MREFTCKNKCALPIARVWELKCDFEFEKRMALQEKRTVTRKGADESVVAMDGQNVVRRTIVVELDEDVIPTILRRWVKASDLTTDVTSSWNPDNYGREHASMTFTSFRSFDGIEFRFSQWLEELSGSQTDICTEVYVSVDVVDLPRWVLDTIEKVVESQLRASLKRFAVEAAKECSATKQVAEYKVPRTKRKGVRLSQDDSEDYESDVVPYRKGASCCVVRCVLCGFVKIVCGHE